MTALRPFAWVSWNNLRVTAPLIAGVTVASQRTAVSFEITRAWWTTRTNKLLNGKKESRRKARNWTGSFRNGSAEIVKRVEPGELKADPCP